MLENSALGQLYPVPATLECQLWSWIKDRREKTYAMVMMNVPVFRAAMGTMTQ
jgi:hypothetical protein